MSRASGISHHDNFMYIYLFFFPIKIADTQAKLQLESIQITLNAKNKEVGLLHIALEQRDAEIERLTELTR